MLTSLAKVRLSFLLAAAGAWCAACGGDSSAIFSDVPAENGATSATAGSAGKATGATEQGGSLSNGGTESAGGSTPSGGTNEQAGTSAMSGGGEPGAGSGSGGTAGRDSGGGSGGTADSGGSGGTGGASGSGGATGSAGTSGGGGSGGSGGSTNNGAPCPDVFGDYTITNAEGNCYGLNQEATQSITGSAPQCLAHFVSVPQDGGRGINGAGALDGTGAFKGAVLSFNDTQRTNCTGAWDADSERMTVECGGLGEQCTVVLERD